MKYNCLIIWTVLSSCFLPGMTTHAQKMSVCREIHVSSMGADMNNGTLSSPLRTIQAAAELAKPGDVITVHEGVYRERVTPPRGGESPEKNDPVSGGCRRKGGDQRVGDYEGMEAYRPEYLDGQDPEYVLRII